MHALCWSNQHWYNPQETLQYWICYVRWIYFLTYPFFPKRIAELRLNYKILYIRDHIYRSDALQKNFSTRAYDDNMQGTPFLHITISHNNLTHESHLIIRITVKCIHTSNCNVYHIYNDGPAMLQRRPTYICPLTLSSSIKLIVCIRGGIVRRSTCRGRYQTKACNRQAELMARKPVPLPALAGNARYREIIWNAFPSRNETNKSSND